MIIVIGYLNNMDREITISIKDVEIPLNQEKKDITESSILLVDENDIEKPKIINSIIRKPVIDPNLITSESYIVGNLKTDEIYLNFNSDKIFPIASLSKLFTALVADHIISTSTKITITKNMTNAIGDAGHLIIDEKFTANELLYPLLLESSNDAAEAIAQSFGYEKFIKNMNDFALEIGMNNTSFKDASGLNSENVSNSLDLFTLSKYFYKNEKDLLGITRTKEIVFATTTDHGYHHFFSINPFVFYKPFIGGKTGRTEEAKESMITMLNMEINGNTYPISIIVLRSKYGERETDTEKILDLFNKKVTN
jgi:D-alanyl-D-alanine carboxypeptidase